MIKIGEINYLNVYPIYYFLKKEIEYSRPKLNFIEFVSGTPAFLNLALKNAAVDISPSSSFYYALNYESLLLFKNLSISSKKRVKSILLFSPKSIGEFLDNETIYITPETATSINLLKVLLAEKYKLDFHKINFIILPSNYNYELKEDFNVKNGRIYLHIGDKAISFEKNLPKDYFCYDLAVLWYELTGLPFVFALFIIRKDAYENNIDEFLILYNYLIKSKEKAVNNFQEALDSIITNSFYNFISREELLDYWTNCLNFDLGEKELLGFKLYSEFLYKNKIIPAIPKINFI
jgi:chorismate dehydratase